MKIVRIALNADDRKRLEDLQINGSGMLRERSLAVLHCAEGRKITWIAQAVNRRPLTVRTWIAQYQKNGIAGLNRAFSPGRPSQRQGELKPRLEEYLTKTPRDYGWHEDLWTVAVIKAQLQKEQKKIFSESTLERLLKDCGYSFKRPRKGVPSTAPGKEEKLARVQKIAEEILNLDKDSGVEVVFLAESHFSTEPYVIRGWHRKGEPFFPRDQSEKGGHVGIWRIQTGDKVFLLEECTFKQQCRVQKFSASAGCSQTQTDTGDHT